MPFGLPDKPLFRAIRLPFFAVAAIFREKTFKTLLRLKGPCSSLSSLLLTKTNFLMQFYSPAMHHRARLGEVEVDAAAVW